MKHGDLEVLVQHHFEGQRITTSLFLSCLRLIYNLPRYPVEMERTAESLVARTREDWVHV